MLNHEEETKLLAFLASLAGLVGIAVAVSQLKIGSVSTDTIRAWFSVVLVLFMFIAALTYFVTLQGKNPMQMNMALLGYFAALLGFSIGLSLASLLPTNLQYWSFWIIAVISAIGFYLTLQRLHGKLQWSKEAK
jgi:hypothetical protein